MDISVLDVRTNSETPRFLHLRKQGTGEFLEDDNGPVGVMVVGSSSRKLQTEGVESARKKLEGAGEDEKEMMVTNLHRDICEAASRVITEFVNISRGDTELDANNREHMEWFLDLTFVSMKELMRRPEQTGWLEPSFAQQIVAFSTTMGNFEGPISTQ